MEIRKDYIEDKWVIINPARGKRPHEFVQEPTPQHDTAVCSFCPGNEKLAPPEIGRISAPDGKWRMRWFENKFAFVKLEGNPIVKTDNTYFTFSSAYGKQEVIVETDDHSKQLWDLDEADVKQLFEIYKMRIEELSKMPNINYVSVFKNHGKAAGTSLLHSHSQIVAYNILPNKIGKLIKRVEEFSHCPYCDILNVEKRSYRRVWEDNNFVAFCPYASRFSYEVWVFPKRHVSKLAQLSEEEMWSLSKAMKYLLVKLKSINAEFNYFLNYSPFTEDFHFHIRINPRFSIWAGFEWSTDCVINSVPPEDAAKFYRGEM